MWHTFWDFLWSAIVIFAFIAYLLILFNIVVDMFWRDHQTSGWVKAIWVVFLIVFPYLTALVYLIARGRAWRFGHANLPLRLSGKPTPISAMSQAARRPRRSPTPRSCSTPAPSLKPSSNR